MALTTEQYNLQQKGTTVFLWLARLTATAMQGGNVKRIAFWTRDVIFQGETYFAAPFDVSQFQVSSGLEVNNASFSTALADALSRLNIRGSIWQGAKTELMLVSMDNLSAGYVERHVGSFGDATLAGQKVEIEYRSNMQKLAQEIGERTSRTCRYQLGDSRCKKDITNFKFSGTVTNAIPPTKQEFSISVSKPDKYFYRGRIKFTSGQNAGLSMETQGNVGQTLTLFMPMPGNIAVGDAFEIVAGDDKTIETCHGKFGNAINFGGEPCMPNREDLYKFPD